MSRKGAIPIPYIIALILGIAVVAVIGYWFFIMPGQLSRQQCEAKKLEFCTLWKALKQEVDGKPAVVGKTWSEYSECSTFYSDITVNSPGDCGETGGGGTQLRECVGNEVGCPDLCRCPSGTSCTDDHICK